MKKFVSILLAVVMVISVCSIWVSAENVELSDVSVPHPYYCGDVNRDLSIDILDVTEVQLAIAKEIELIEISCQLADVDGDGEVTILDVTMIQRYVAKLIYGFKNTMNYLFAYINVIGIETTADLDDLHATQSFEIKTLYSVSHDDYYIPEEFKVLYEVSHNGEAIYGIAHGQEVANIYCPYAGDYLVEIMVIDEYGDVGEYTFEFSVKEEIPNENLVYSDGSYQIGVALPDEEPVRVDFETVLSGVYKTGDHKADDEEFSAIVKSREQYDQLFNVHNDMFTDEFFEDKWLVVSVKSMFNGSLTADIQSLSVVQNSNTLSIDATGFTHGDTDVIQPYPYQYYSFVAVDREQLPFVKRICWHKYVYI